MANYTTTADLTTLLAAKQDTLTFDNVPTENSNNPVKSGGVYEANQTLTNEVKGHWSEGGKNLLPLKVRTGTSYGITVTRDSKDNVIIDGTSTGNPAQISLFDTIAIRIGDATSILLEDLGIDTSKQYVLARATKVTNLRYKIEFFEGTTSLGSFELGNNQDLYRDIPFSDYPTCDRIKAAVVVPISTTFSNQEITPMICLKSLYDLEPTYEPYAKTNQQLTKDAENITGLLDNLEVNGAVNMLPNTATSQTINSVEWTVNSDGTVQAYLPSGTTTSEESNLIIAPSDEMNALLSEYGELKLVGCPVGGSDQTGGYGIRCKQGSSYPRDIGNGIILKSSGGTVNIGLSCNIREGATGPMTLLFKPMIGLVSTPNFDYAHYVPYAKTNRQLTEDSVDWDDYSEVGAVNLFKNTLTTQTVNGVTYTVNDDLSVSTANSATANGGVMLGGFTAKKGKTYRISGCPSGGDADDTYALIVRATNSTSGSVIGSDVGDGFIYTPSADTTIYLQIRFASGQSASGLKFSPMITLPSYNGDYVPYAKSNKELTEDVAEMVKGGGYVYPLPNYFYHIAITATKGSGQFIKLITNHGEVKLATSSQSMGANTLARQKVLINDNTNQFDWTYSVSGMTANLNCTGHVVGFIISNYPLTFTVEDTSTPEANTLNTLNLALLSNS